MAPRVYLEFDGLDNYVEVPDSQDFSVAGGGFSVAAWIRPDTRFFPCSEGSGYVHWLGKGQRDAQEWVLRIYSLDNTEGRDNRISFYLFNPHGGLGVGSYSQDQIEPGRWIHVAGTADGNAAALYINGTMRKATVYAGRITPAHGPAPLRMGTRDFRSYFQGALAHVRVWTRALSNSEVSGLYHHGVVPGDDLAAQYLLDEGEGDLVGDTADGHPGSIVGATWGAAVGGVPSPPREPAGGQTHVPY